MMPKALPYPFLKSRKRAVRTFKLEIALPSPYGDWFEEVINTIEKNELLVFDANDGEGLAEILDEKGGIFVNAGAKIPIKIREWLPLACQIVEFSHSKEFDEDTWAIYRNNLVTAIFQPSAEHFGLGMPLARIFHSDPSMKYPG